jgi:cysteine desulfurase
MAPNRQEERAMNKGAPEIYADNAATTRLSDAAWQAMQPFLREQYGNPSALYRLGREARKAVENARARIARQLGASSAEIYFTSGGTEADNWALKGTMMGLGARPNTQNKRHLITSCVEHPAVLNSAKALERAGYEVTYLPVDAQGRVSSADVRAALREDTALVSIQYANNEVGTIQPVEEIGALCRAAGVLFHTDAVQAAGTLELDMAKQPFDLLALSAHKFHGPKGAGVLYCRKGACPQSFLDGGKQENARRAGTENVAAIVGMAAALEEACVDREANAARVQALRDAVQAQLAGLPGAKVNGGGAARLPGILSVSFEGADGQSLLYEMDLRGVAVSSGSACTAGSIEPSHVLRAMGLPYALAHGSMRISLGRYNTEQEIEPLVRAVRESLAATRN